MVMFRLHSRCLIAPQQAIAAHLHHLLVTRLSTKVPQLPEVVIEGMLPRDLANKKYLKKK